jgi:hypothetical protein
MARSHSADLQAQQQVGERLGDTQQRHLDGGGVQHRHGQQG